jgi:hypothetical protein
MASLSATADTEPYQVVSTVEGEIRELLRKQSGVSGRGVHAPAEQGPDAISSLLANVAGHAVSEIDRVITELQDVRDFLEAESERVRQEVAKFAEMSQDALASIKSINCAIEPWKGPSSGQPR